MTMFNIKNRPFRTIYEVCFLVLMIYAILSSGKFAQLIFEHLWQTALAILILGILASLLDTVWAHITKKGVK